MSRVEIWNGYPEGSMLAGLDIPDGISDAEHRAATIAAKLTAEQMLGKFGITTNLRVIMVPEAPTAQDSAAEIERAHAIEAAGGTLLDTAEVLGSRYNFLDWKV